MNVNFAAVPAQSPALANLNIPLPAALADIELRDQNLMRDRITEAVR